jgi:hypothetical protein
LFKRVCEWVIGLDREVERRVSVKMSRRETYLLDQYHQRIQDTYSHINKSVGSLHRTVNELRETMQNHNLIPTKGESS